MSRIFISYKRVDKDKVFKIKDQIESALGEKCWIDVDGIESGNFAQQTLLAIEKSSVMLFFYSKQSENSQWQRRELEYAVQNNKAIIPILIDEIPNDSWYYNHLAKYQIVRAEYDDVITVIQKIIKDNKQTSSQRCYRLFSFKRFGCLCLIIILFLLIALTFFWQGAPNSPAPNKNWPEEVMCEKPNVDSCVSDSIACDPTVESIGDDFKYADTFGFKDITKLSVSELELEALRIQYIIDSLWLANNTDEALFLCHKYQYQLREALYNRHSANSDVTYNRHSANSDITSLESEEEIESGSISYLWFIIILPLLIFGYYLKRRKSIETQKRKSEKNNISQKQSNVPLFSQRREIKIFIAGSTRLVGEREALRATISKMYNQHKNDNLVVEAYEFDDFTREYVEGGQQKLYDDFIRNEANWVVFITDGTIGDKTIWELENAIKVHKETGHPKILMYSIPQNITDNQKEQMSQFKSILNREDNYWIDYEDVSTIRSTFREHLEWDLINLMKQELRRVG